MKNFKFKKKTRFESCGYDVSEYEHISGAKLVYLDTGSDEKAFCAAFKTIPEDSTGVFHILEHSVLDGSKNYPMNSPFLFMIKNSMSTFLNAMTFQGKTMYPCASCNPDDFENLLKVYLDSVFNPLLAEGTFLREGWHIEKAESGYDIKGVVYNEMQGAMASVQRLLYSAMTSDLYPDTYQKYNSGGEPDTIPTLTYENYLAAYRKYYSTANCVLFLSGNMDIDRYTDIIDEWLAGASQQRSEIKHSVQGENHRICEHEYPVSPNEELAGKTNIIYSYNIGNYDQYERQIAASLLANYLMDNMSSPLKSALTASGLMQDSDIFTSDDDIQTAWGIAAYNTDPENRDAIKKVIDSTVRSIIENGIDKEIMLSQISSAAFKMKAQRNDVTERTINDFIKLANNVFYNVPLDTYFELDEIFEKLEREVGNGYFEKLLSEIFIENDITAISTLVPVHKESNAQHVATVKKYTEPLTTEEKDAAHERFVVGTKLAMERDTPETVAKMPHLDIDQLTKELPKREFVANGKLLFTPANTNGIGYYRFYFPLAGLTADETMTAKLIVATLGEFSTENHSASELNSLLSRYAGKWSFDAEVITKTASDVEPYAIVSVACLEKNADKALEIISDILNSTVYDTETASAVIARSINNAKMSFIGNGIGLAIVECESSISRGGYYSSLFNGYRYYGKLNEYSADSSKFCKDAGDLIHRIFNASNLKYVGFTGNEQLSHKELALPEGKALEGETLVNTEKGSTAYAIPAGISFNVRSIDYSNILQFSGKHLALSNLLTFGYLWHNIREVGGAYGTGHQFKRNGIMTVYSYRDPKVGETYALYDEIAEYLRTNEFTDGEILGCIISTLASFVNPKPVYEMGMENEIYHLTGYTHERREKHMNDVLSFSAEDIKSFIPVFEAFKTSGVECSVGNGNAQAEYGKFDKIVNI